MVYEFIIPGKLKSLNELLDAPNRRTANGIKSRQQMICYAAIKQSLPGLHIKKPVRLHYCYHETDRRRDLDNIAGFAHKVIQDALVKARVLENDGWRNVVGFSDEFQCDRKDPHIIVRIEEVEDRGGR